MGLPGVGRRGVGAVGALDGERALLHVKREGSPLLRPREQAIDDGPRAEAQLVGLASDPDVKVIVGDGALILGAAGLLQGYQATTHWAWHDLLALFGAEPVQARHVIDRNRATGGGVTAGIDFALALMAQIVGDDHARAVQLALEYDPAPPFESGSPAKAGAALVDVYTARANRLAPTRREDLIAAAHRLGFSGG